MRANTWLVLVGIAFFGAVIGCHGHPESVSQGIVAPEGDAVRDFVQGLSQDEAWLRSLGSAYSSGSHNVPAMEEALAQCGSETLSQFYEARRYKAMILQPSADYSQEALGILASIQSHGADFRPKHQEEIDALVAQKSARVQESSPVWSMQKSDVDSLTAALKAHNFALSQTAPKEALSALLEGEQCEAYWPRYCAFKAEQAEAHKADMAQEARLEVLLGCDLLAWASVLRLGYGQNTYRFDPWRALLEEQSVKRIRERVFLSELATNGPRHAFGRIQPRDAQYRALREARSVYLEAMAKGGWVSIDAPKKMPAHKLGQSYPYINDIRKRLAEEKYLIGELDSDVYDEHLESAVALYRELHQLSPKKSIDSTLIRNMAVPPEARLESIDKTLQRYRESPLGELDYYVFVNVPDFFAELWRNGRRLHRFRVVVGNNTMKKDPITNKPMRDPVTKEIIFPNRTPLISAKLNEIIYNPYWNVPARIRMEELEPKLLENPNYYAENFFEEVNVDDPRLYYVRELPNPNNSLGKVKFMFPNDHDVYLHDTPAKSIFKNPTRAYSHGCVRVQDPLDLAQILLQEDGTWDEAAVRSVLTQEPLTQTSFFLERPVDVVISYFDTRVDDTGIVAFLSDVYGYDAQTK